ncbi:MAG: alpha/beta hydrolase-fold protein [Methylococcales bacterium]|jgi:phospholipase/carboxylesterase
MTELATIELTTIELRPDTEQRYSVIWMHGLGADGHDFEAIVPELGLPEGHGIGFIFPNAPVQPVTINGGMEMRAWYDILDMSFQRKVDVEGIYQSSAAIDLLIKKELKRGIAAEHILLAGFSQGGAIALHTALTYPDRLAGVLALSTYLPTLEDIKSEFSQNNRALPIFMAHGTMDAVVDIQIAKKAYQGIKALAYPISWHEYPMQHAVCQQEIKAISEFIRAVFKD